MPVVNETADSTVYYCTLSTVRQYMHINMWATTSTYAKYTYPSPFGVEVSQIQGLLFATVNTGDGTSDFTRYESGTASRAFVVEQDTVRQMHAVSLCTNT